jgi:hypothetical protein
MAKLQAATELMGVLDYILNRCTLREIDALEAAVERRRRDLASQTGIISLDPSRAAREMSGAVQNSINQSMDSIRGTFREFAADLIRKEAPELTEGQMAELLDQWIPENMSMDASGKVSSSSAGPGPVDSSSMPTDPANYTGLAKKGLINGVPPDAMYEMIRQFVEYSGGAMPIAEEASLREAVGDWTAIYWKKFPREIQDLIRQFLAGSLTGAEFDSYLSQLLQ